MEYSELDALPQGFLDGVGGLAQELTDYKSLAAKVNGLNELNGKHRKTIADLKAAGGTPYEGEYSIPFGASAEIVSAMGMDTPAAKALLDRAKASGFDQEQYSQFLQSLHNKKGAYDTARAELRASEMKTAFGETAPATLQNLKTFMAGQLSPDMAQILNANIDAHASPEMIRVLQAIQEKMNPSQIPTFVNGVPAGANTKIAGVEFTGKVMPDGTYNEGNAHSAVDANGRYLIEYNQEWKTFDEKLRMESRRHRK